MENIYQAINSNHKTEVIILLLDKKRQDKSGQKKRKSHYMIIKGSTYQEDINFINNYAPNIRKPVYAKHVLTKVIIK